MNLTIKKWKNLFKIDALDIIDLKGWNPYSLSEGLVHDNTEVELSLVEIARLSPLESSKIEKIIRFSKV